MTEFKQYRNKANKLIDDAEDGESISWEKAHEFAIFNLRGANL